jgi:hypothetical protein
VSVHQIELHTLTLTVQGIFHFFGDGQHLCISVEALVVPVAEVAKFSVRASFDCLIEMINGISCNLRFGMLALSESVRSLKGDTKRTIGFGVFSRVSFNSLLLHALAVRLIGWISKEAAGFERVRFPEAPRPAAGFVLDGRMSATCVDCCMCQNKNKRVLRGLASALDGSVS